MAFASDADEMFFGGAGGGGKRLSLGTLLPTPTGWTTIGAVKVGDELFDGQGNVCRVTAVSPIEVSEEVYRLVFDDGSDIIACAEHLWLTHTISDRAAMLRRTPEYRERRQASRASRITGNKSERFTTALIERNKVRAYDLLDAPAGSVKTTREIYETREVRGRVNHSIPVAEPLDLPDQPLPLDPYLLGLWLGDGASHNGRISTADQQIIDAWHEAGFETRHYGKYDHGIYGLKVILRDDLGVLQNKHIPAAYLRASAAQRLALLQGLMDTDGAVKDSGAAVFCTTNEQLAKGVHEIIVSLGWKATLREGRAKLYGRDISAKWELDWMPSQCVFRLKRKAERQKLASRPTTKHRYITEMRRIDPRPMRCIAVDSPSRLYLAGRQMVPTHNTDLAIGLALLKHTRAAIFRRTYGELSFIIDRLKEVVPKDYGSFTVNASRYTLYDKPGHIIELAGIEQEEHVAKWRGRPHDLKYFDEASEFLKDQFVWLTAWARTTDPNQHVLTLLGSNPPKGVEGYWLVERYAPWLDPRHPEFPVPTGELRYYAMLDDVDTLLEDGTPFVHKGERIRPMSRTFIRSKVQDNPYQTPDYIARLQMLPEPLRGQILRGDFTIGMEDDAYQVIPTAWILAAVERGRNREMPPLPLSQVGVDVARGGVDWTIFARRAGNWILPLQRQAGTATTNGAVVAQHALSIVHGTAARPPVCIDTTGGWGTSPFDVISANWPETYGVNANVKVEARDRTGSYKFLNTRAYLWWSLRELLDPDNSLIPESERLILPDDPDLIVQLASPRYMTKQGGWLQIESKDDIRKRLGRSTDEADAVLLTLFPVSDVSEMKMTHLATDPREAAMMGVDMRGWDDD